MEGFIFLTINYLFFAIVYFSVGPSTISLGHFYTASMEPETAFTPWTTTI